MSSESWLPAVTGGSVAARVQAFQDIQHLEDFTPHFKQTPRVMTRALESGTTVGRGTRSSSNFASPATRVSRDGNEGARGDGRPPVGNVTFKSHPAMEEKEVWRRKPLRLAPRPHTTFGESRNELIEARQRLRSVIPEGKEEPCEQVGDSIEEQKQYKTTEPITKVTNTKVLEELGDLLDNAIEEQAVDQSTDQSQLQSPKTITQGDPAKPYQRSRSQVQSVFHCPKISTVGPADGLRTSRTDLKTNKYGMVNPRSSFETHRIESKSNASSMDDLTKVADASSIDLPLPRPKMAVKESSPVKDRAAIFERLGRKSSSPHQRHIPPIPLALPQLLSSQHQPRSSTQSSLGTIPLYTTAPQSGGSSEAPTRSPLVDPGDKMIRQVSRGWPFSWGSSNKTPIAAPQQTDVQIPADPERDEHKPLTNKMQGRVQSLLAATSRGSIGVAEMKEHVTDTAPIQPGKTLPPLQAPIQEQGMMFVEGGQQSPSGTEEFLTEEKGRDTRGSTTKTIIPAIPAVFPISTGQQEQPQPPTPSRSPATEKEVMSTPNLESDSKLRAITSSGSPSPTKRDVLLNPTTPLRGRRKTRHPTGGAGYGVERKFALSKSRSRSGGVRVSVEVRTSPEKPDEAIVVVRANVEPLRESEDSE